MTNSESEKLTKTKNFAHSFHHGEGTGHDWFHVQRVNKMAIKIAEFEGVNSFKVSIIALLHDVADYKLNNGDENIGYQKIKKFLSSIDFNNQEIESIIKDIKEISFMGGNNIVDNQSIESKIVQDADRLDALGAIGIARAFAYGGSKNRLLFDPSCKPNLNQTKAEYKNSNAPTINHFYEKLLVLKDKMNTSYAIQIAEERHAFLEIFLEQFYKEWGDEK
ncbi:MAG: HD domain-containing protein [Flavobacteriales bacterium]|nr:HD domain-containing protein [Flavobacteriales bacterium]